MNELPRAVSFDLDGTLYSTRRAVPRLLFSMFGRLRFLSTYRKVRQAIRERVYEDGDALHRAELQALSAAIGKPEDETARLLHQVHEVELCGALGRAGPFAEARPLVAGLVQRGVPVAVLSDLPVVSKLAALGLDDLGWGITLDAGDTGALKPHPRSFERVAEALGVAVQELVHVGDRHDTDVTGAQQIGAQAVWLTRRPDLPVAEGTWIVSGLGELMERWGISA